MVRAAAATRASYVTQDCGVTSCKTQLLPKGHVGEIERLDLP